MAVMSEQMKVMTTSVGSMTRSDARLLFRVATETMAHR